MRGVWGDMAGEGECGGDMTGEGSVGETWLVRECGETWLVRGSVGET